MKSSQLSFLISSMVMMLLLGSIYAWGIFRVEVERVYQINATLSGLPYMVSLVSYAVAMLVAGKWMATHRSTLILAGTIMFTLGLWLSSIPGSFFILILSYGFLLGSGVGFLYGVPVFMVQRLFHHHIGLYSGLILMGFGLANTVMTPVIAQLLNQQTIHETFRILGWIALAVFAITIWPLFHPLPKTTLRENQLPDTPYDRPSFRWLYVVLMLSLISGLTIVGLSFRIGVITYQFDEGDVTIAISTFAFINGISRPFIGGLVDRFGFFKVAFVSLLSLVISGFISLFNGGTLPVLYAISFGAFWFGLGNWMALMPLAIKTLFPAHYFSQLYGKLFTAYGVAAIIGTLFSGVILDLTNTTWPIYLLIVAVNIANLFIVLWLKKRYHLTFFNKAIFKKAF